MFDGLDVMEEMEGKDQKEVRNRWKSFDKMTGITAALTAWKKNTAIV